jgi:hypothetical protein
VCGARSRINKNCPNEIGTESNPEHNLSPVDEGILHPHYSTSSSSGTYGQFLRSKHTPQPFSIECPLATGSKLDPSNNLAVCHREIWN